MNEETKTKIEDFLKEKSLDHCYFLDYVDIENIDLDNPFDSIEEMINDNDGFNVEIIYYSNAIEYLRENDPSLQESLQLAYEYGYQVDKLNSEILASILATQNVRNEFYELKDDIESFFEELKEESEEE